MGKTIIQDEVGEMPEMEEQEAAPEPAPAPEWQGSEIVHRTVDDSYVVVRQGRPYHVPNLDEWAELWAAIHVYVQEHPEQVRQELPPPPAPEPTPEELLAAAQKAFSDAIQARLDTFAQSCGYDGILSACTYASSSIEIYRIEGQYCVDARDLTWGKAFDLLNSFNPGDPLPSWKNVEAQLPPLAWPEGSRGYRG